jgi:hypothetical protein
MAASAAEADARTRRTQANVQTQRGQYQVRSEVNRSRGLRTRDAVVTGPAGRQSSVHDQRSWNAHDGTSAHVRQSTFANGDTRSVEANAVRTAPGEWSGVRTVTGRNGQTRTQSGDFSVERTENGRIVTGDIQTSNAGQIDYTREVSRGSGVRTMSSTATFEDETSRAVDRTRISNGDGTGTVNRTVTTRTGETRSQTATYQVEPQP